ncbi:MAG UNVERIFIED_CONTAM: hypothetical protein LVT10_02060 [Anaerolineae bacterium]
MASPLQPIISLLQPLTASHRVVLVPTRAPCGNLRPPPASPAWADMAHALSQRPRSATRLTDVIGIGHLVLGRPPQSRWRWNARNAFSAVVLLRPRDLPALCIAHGATDERAGA